jgi:DNA-binding NtrC family response regulator
MSARRHDGDDARVLFPTMRETVAAPRPKKILLIDDDEMVVGPLRSYLVAQGCEVDLACDRAGAELLMALYTYDTVMVDPYLTGAASSDRLALVDAARTMQSAASLIVMTAYATPAISESHSSGGIKTLMIKPQPVTELGRVALGGRPIPNHRSPIASGESPD